jgi:outer membrane protein
MKRSLAVVCSFSLLSFSGGVFAQTPTSEAHPEHLVTVSFNAAVLQTTEAQHEFAALQTRYAPRQAQLQTLNDEVESLRKQLSGGGDKLTDAEKESREKSLDSKEKELQRQAEDFRNDSQADSQQIYQRIAQKVYAFLQTYSQRNGFSIVIERGSDASPVVWYMAKNMDITDELIKAYNAEGETTSHSSTNKTAPTRSPQQPLPSAPAPH